MGIGVQDRPLGNAAAQGAAASPSGDPEFKPPAAHMDRTWKVSKTREAKPKVRLYLAGRVVLEQPVATVVAGNRLGRAWAETEESR